MSEHRASQQLDTQTKKPAQHGNRLDALDGIRTVAVFLVILFHVSAPAMRAGYIGVDMFFVLSGYLITAGLVRDIRSRGRVRLAHFWSRRFKRLMPAALLTILAVFVWAQWYAPLYKRADIGTDAWWTIFYLANWRFVNSASYFEADGTLSPLEHMWSLAVEEQFYLVWPLIISLVLLIFYAASRRRMPKQTSEVQGNCTPEQADIRERALKVLIAVAAIIIVISAILLYAKTAVSQNRAYMGTDAKAFEPMLGALLAMLASYPSIAAWFSKYSHALVWGGGLVMIALFAKLDGPPPAYFMGAAFVFSLAMGAFIVGIAHGLNNFEAKILAWGPISYLGRISYGLYLWHWPFAVWLLQPALGFQPVRALAVIALTIVTAVISYHLIEMPIRAGKIGRLLTPRRAISSAFIAMLVTAIIVSFLGGTPLSRTVEPELRKLIGNDSSPVVASTVMVVGDSVPMRLVPALAPVAQKRGWDIISAAQGACTPMGLKLEFGPDDPTGVGCPSVVAGQQEALAQYRPGIVLWWSRYETIDRYMEDGTTLLTPETEEFWVAQEKDFIESLDRFTADGATVILVLTERPGLGMLSRDEKTLGLPLIQNMMFHDDYRQRWNEVVRRIAATRDDLFVIEGDSLFCSSDPTGRSDSLCDDSVGDLGYMRPDGSHVNVELFGESVSNELLDSMEKIIRENSINKE